MVSGDNVTVTLTGGGPWGFRLTGGGSLPLQIAKIRKKSQAHAQGLKEGDAVVSINGLPVHDRTHDEAVDLIDAAGDTLTLQIYRGDADDLGRLLANKKTQGPILTPQDEGDHLLTSSSHTVTSSTSSLQDDGRTRREVQQNVFVTSGGDSQSSTFVRREHTVTSSTTTSSSFGDVNGNDVGMPITVEPIKALSPAPPPVSPKPSSSPRPLSPAVPPAPTFTIQTQSAPPLEPTFTIQTQSAPPPPPPASSQPAGPTWVPRPTFKALPPKLAPEVAPKPLLGPPVAPKPQVAAKPSFNAKGGNQPFSPVKFQVSATAMVTPPPHSPNTGPKPFTPHGQSSYQPASQPYQPASQPYSPGDQPSFLIKQQQQQAFSQSSQQTYRRQSSSKQQVYSPGAQQPFSPAAQQPFSPLSLQSPMSPTTSHQPFSPLSPGGGAPMFNVRNNFGEGSKTWTPNLWLPGQEPQPQQQPRQQRQQQQYQQQESENIEVPKRMSIKERQQMLLAHAAHTKHSLSARQADPDFDAPPEEVQREMARGHQHQHQHQHHKPHVFGPPVEIHPEGPVDDLGLVRTDSDDSETSSFIHRKKKVYSDSAFYEDPSKKYPTIQEQMKLCRLISQSLTSAANRRARGAKMFAKRQKKSSKWVHAGHSEWSSSAGDVANIHDLDSELSPDEGGHKQLFYFRIPSLKGRVGSPEKNTKMSLRKDEFERLRLDAQKCDHKAVSPNMCFDIAADLKASKGRAGRLFERRKNRADKFIIDESNARLAGPKQTKLDGLLASPLKSRQSPWEAAQSGRGLDAAFDHLSERERMAKLNQILQYQPPAPKHPPVNVLQEFNPPPPGPRSNLKGGSNVPLLQGRNFNRFAKGWNAGGDYSERASTLPSQSSSQQPPAPRLSHDYPPESAPRAQPAKYGDYNPRPRAWQGGAGGGGGGGDSLSCPASMSASWNSSDFEAGYQANGYGGHCSPDYLPACDL